jgi:predicted nucleic acid-binding Zn ribbon protein
MPLYTYRFDDTGKTTEVRQSIHDDALTEIDGRPVQRIIVTAPPAIFNADGFYRNTR